MYTLPHQVEYLSDAWLDEAKAYLDRMLPQRRAELGDWPFRAAWRFTDAPPHMGFDGGVAAFSLRYDGQDISLSRAFDREADLRLEGDFQAALSFAQMVGIRATGARQTAIEDVRAIYGADAYRPTGAARNDAWEKLLADLHDHMGRRTVENPDLAHRAERQGLTGKIREMEDLGYTVLERAITPQFAEEVREATINALASQQATTLNWMLYQGRPFEKLTLNPLLMTLIDASLGRGAVVASLSAIQRGPGPGTIPLHVDYAHVPEPFPEFAMTGVGVWALENWTAESGPTWIIPGSHKFRRGPRRGEGANGGVPIEMPKGSVVFFTHGVWHWQGDRTAPGDRVTLHMHFNRGILRSLEPKKVDVQMMHRNPPRLGEMLGEDDWFEKIDAHGRDYGRLAHMNRLHAFTEAQKAKILAETAVA